MKVYFVCIITVIIAFFSNCKKEEKGSPYTKDLGGSHSFRRIYSGTHPYTGPFSDTQIMTMSIVYKDNATIVFDEHTFSYVSDTDILHYQYKDNSKYAYGDLYYDHAANKITVSETWHVSAAAGNWGNFYQSL